LFNVGSQNAVLFFNWTLELESRHGKQGDDNQVGWPNRKRQVGYFKKANCKSGKRPVFAVKADSPGM
jgi:hypothetical protein